ncbi:tetratricopeptide repeat protein [Chitinophaga sp. XS-30]|uniref:tetratricopeptide repeat protein n=1 Tax=Chitinophaga sp. XS-30 TaxID=2604421 RepID=UPI0011DD36B9|nr:tetratricopeptide repeat protein [Chitinophaga sp. XS-30]QEH43648.1 tetratricopeptide repeat protein [Chitinophaga sp. XS-30]
MRFLFVITLFFSISVNVSARQKHYDFNARCREAYDAVMQLRLDAGRALLEEEKRSDPDNLIPYFIDNYIDFFTLFFNEDPAQYARQRKFRATRLELMAEGPKGSPYHLYTQAVIKFQWAMVKVKFSEKWDATWEIRKAYFTLKDNQKKFPQFLPNNMIIGSMQTVFGTIPEGYKWITNILGLRGSIKQGMQLLQSVIDSNDPTAAIFREESYYYYCYLKLFIENKPEQLWQFIRQKQLDIRNNYLFALMVANLSLNDQKAEQGIRILTERNHSREYATIHYHDYVMGLLKLERQDADAITYLERFVREFRGKFYVKEALQRLSWAYYLKGDAATASKYRAMVLQRGNQETDADKQAQKEAKNGKWPNPLLLRARLMSDGGFYQQALNLLLDKRANDFATVEEKLEFAYRLARIYDEMGQDDNAIRLYETTVKLGSNRPEYFAARSALQLGYIYEKSGNSTKARQSFQACMDMEGHDYKNSLDQRAKSGLLRLDGK